MNRDEMEFENLLEKSEVKDFLRRAEREMFPKMKDSAFCLAMMNSEPDAKMALEIGAAILFGKPIVVLAIGGREVPATLRRIAARIVEVDGISSTADQEKVIKALKDITTKC
jgi:hypothetical protein